MKFINIKMFFFMTLLLGSMFSSIFAQKLDFSTYLISNEEVHSTPRSATDKDGNIFVVGGTRSGLKVTNDAYQKEYKGHSNWVGGDIFLMKLSPEGELLYSSYIGAAGNEAYCGNIALDDSGNVYIAMMSDSKGLPVSENAYQKINKSDGDRYIIKFSNSGQYLASTYFGGTGPDHWPEVIINNNMLYLIGVSQSTDYPTTKGVIQEKLNEGTGGESVPSWMVRDITITALSLNLDKVYHSTYLGGSKLDVVNSCYFDNHGNIVLSGSTNSEDYPTTQNAFDTSINGGQDIFVTVIKPDLSEIIYSTFIGGSSDDNRPSIISINNNELVISGNTKSSDFPITTNALDSELGGDEDGVLLKLNIKTNELLYSSYIGGTGTDYIAYGSETKKGKYILVGRTNSTDIPVSENAIDKSFNGGKDLMVLLLDNSLKKIEYSTYIGGSNDDAWQAAPNAYLTNDDNLLVIAVTSSPDFPTTNKIAEVPSFEMVYLVKVDL